MADITKAGRSVGQGLMDVIGAVTSPVAPILEQIPKIAAQYQALQGNPAALQLQQQQQNQNLMQQLVNQQMAGTSTDQVNPQIQMAIATKDYSTASKLLSQQQQRDKFMSSVEKDRMLTPEHKQLLTDALNSGVDVRSAADLRARLTLGSEAVKRKVEEEAKKPSQAAAVTTAQLQAKQALEVTPEKIVQAVQAENPNLSVEDLKKVAYSKMLERKLFSDKEGKTKFDRFWEGQQIVGNVPKAPGFLEKIQNLFSPKQEQQAPQQTKPAQQAQPQGQVLVSPSTGRRFMKNSDGSLTEIK